jgi:hypothetical protein
MAIGIVPKLVVWQLAGEIRFVASEITWPRPWVDVLHPAMPRRCVVRGERR